MINATQVYLLAFPDVVSDPTTPSERITGLKDAPYFQPVDISVRSLPGLELQVDSVAVSIQRQRFDEQIQIVECRFEVPDPLSMAGIQQRERIQAEMKSRLIPPDIRENGLFEEYGILCIAKTDGNPDSFVDANAADLARFIRSQRESLDPAEVEEILVSRVHYSKDDMTLVDWEAAVIIAPESDFQSDIELLKIGNYQLLRYRVLDQSTEDILHEISREFAKGKQAKTRPARASLRRIVAHRLEIALDFEHTDQNLLLIGDWYTAKLFAIIRDEFYLDEWKSAVRTKLDNLESIIHTIQENFSLSWASLMSNIELAGWIILLIGYFILFFMDLGLVK